LRASLIAIVATVVGLGCPPSSKPDAALAPVPSPSAVLVAPNSASDRPAAPTTSASAVAAPPPADDSAAPLKPGRWVVEPFVPKDGVVVTSSPEDIAAALAASVVRKGGTTTSRGVRIGSDCVRPAEHAAANQGSPGAEAPFETRHDLDGDGVEDLILSTGAAGMSMVWDLYVMRGDCGHHVGQVTAGLPPEPRAVHNGMLSLESRVGCPVDCCEEVITFEVSWDGRRYVAKRRATRRTC
jgi:hypothetical protein